MQFWVLVWDAGNFREHEAYGPYNMRSDAKILADKLSNTANVLIVQTEPECEQPDTV